MKKKIILASMALVMSAAAGTAYKVYQNSKMPTLLDANIEALTHAESDRSVDCYMDFDTPAWFVDDEYHTLCVHPKTGVRCRQVKGHDFENKSRCQLL